MSLKVTAIPSMPLKKMLFLLCHRVSILCSFMPLPSSFCHFAVKWHVKILFFALLLSPLPPIPYSFPPPCTLAYRSIHRAKNTKQDKSMVSINWANQIIKNQINVGPDSASTSCVGVAFTSHGGGPPIPPALHPEGGCLHLPCRPRLHPHLWPFALTTS